jgi:hypothetical protein
MFFALLPTISPTCSVKAAQIFSARSDVYVNGGCFEGLSDSDAGAIWASETSQITVLASSFYNCRAKTGSGGACVFASFVNLLFSNCCGELCSSTLQGHFIHVQGASANGIGAVRLSTIVSCPRDSSGYSGMTVYSLPRPDISHLNFTACNGKQQSAVDAQGDFQLGNPCSYWNVYGCSSDRAVYYAHGDSESEMTVKYGNFDDNTFQYGGFYSGNVGRMTIDHCIFKGNSKVFDKFNALTFGNCVFDCQSMKG